MVGRPVPVAIAPGADLDRRRLAREHRQPMAGRMARQVDQNIDIVGLNPVREFIVRKLPGLDPGLGQ